MYIKDYDIIIIVIHQLSILLLLRIIVLYVCIQLRKKTSKRKNGDLCIKTLGRGKKFLFSWEYYHGLRQLRLYTYIYTNIYIKNMYN